VRRWGGAAGLSVPADMVSQERQREHRGGSSDAPDEVAVVRAQPSGGSMVRCGGQRAAAWRRLSASVDSGERRGQLKLLQHRGRGAMVRRGSI
jgi:hypothetical protein